MSEKLPWGGEGRLGDAVARASKAWPSFRIWTEIDRDLSWLLTAAVRVRGQLYEITLILPAHTDGVSHQMIENDMAIALERWMRQESVP